MYFMIKRNLKRPSVATFNYYSVCVYGLCIWTVYMETKRDLSEQIQILCLQTQDIKPKAEKVHTTYYSKLCFIKACYWTQASQKPKFQKLVVCTSVKMPPRSRELYFQCVAFCSVCHCVC